MIIYPDGGQECLQRNRAKKSGGTTASRQALRKHKAKVGKDRPMYHKVSKKAYRQNLERLVPGWLDYHDWKHMRSIAQEARV